MDSVPPYKVNVKSLRLAILAIRRAEMDFLDPNTRKQDKDSAKMFLFGLRGSPLPLVCEVLGINLLAGRLLILQWKAMGKVGDPLFSYLTDPKNLVRVENGLPILQPDFGSLYAGSNSCG